MLSYFLYKDKELKLCLSFQVSELLQSLWPQMEITVDLQCFVNVHVKKTEILISSPNTVEFHSLESSFQNDSFEW